MKEDFIYRLLLYSALLFIQKTFLVSKQRGLPYLSHSYHGEGTILTQTRQSKAEFQWHFPTKVSKHIRVKTFQTLHLRLYLPTFEILFHSQFH